MNMIMDLSIYVKKVLHIHTIDGWSIFLEVNTVTCRYAAMVTPN